LSQKRDHAKKKHNTSRRRISFMLVGHNLQIYLKTTETCNLNCKHCFTSGSQGQKVFFNPNKTLAFIEDLVELNSVQSLRVVFHGGEPLLASIKDLEDTAHRLKQMSKVTSLGIQTNLALDLSPRHFDFLNRYFLEFGIGTSWDADLRFGDLKKGRKPLLLQKWEENVRTLVKKGHNLTLMVCLSSYLIQNYDPQQIISYAISLGFKNILFERITSDGHAEDNSSIFPDNRDLDNWLHQMLNQTLELKLYEKINNMFLSEMSRSFLTTTHSGNRCRSCEQQILTINASGTVSGCPNSATTHLYGHISDGLNKILHSPKRINSICKEKKRHDLCQACDVRDICNGDCYKLPWQGEVCAAPKSIMRQMATDQNYEDYEMLI